MNKVLVVDTNYKPLNPVRPAEARILLKTKQASILRRYPFTIILKTAVDEWQKPVIIKIDPGSRKTGIVLVEEKSNEVVWAAEIEHHGHIIKKNMDQRRNSRKSRRHRKTRHRQPRFSNRKRKQGWFAPSLESRMQNIETWIKRLEKFTPVKSIVMEWVKFDTQMMENSEISGVEYQQGELQGYEVREYLLEKWGRKCAYCGKEGIPLEIEHIVPKSRGGTNRVSNLTLACHKCNQKKGNQTAEEFGHPEIQKKAKMPLKDAAAINIIRWEILNRLKKTGYSVEVGTGGRTKFNRAQSGYKKKHWIDAACIGESGQGVKLDENQQILEIKAMGRGNRQFCHMNKYGFPRTGPKSNRKVHGFKTGDIVKAGILKGKHKGIHIGRIVIRSSGYFDINGAINTSWKNCEIIQKNDGYSYS